MPPLNASAPAFVPLPARSTPLPSTSLGNPNDPIASMETIFQMTGIKRLTIGQFTKYANWIGVADIQGAYEHYLLGYQQYLVLTIAEAFPNWEAPQIWSCLDALIRSGSLRVLGVGNKGGGKGSGTIENLDPGYFVYLKTHLTEVYTMCTGPSRGFATVPVAPTGPRQQQAPSPGFESGVGSSRTIATAPVAPTNPGPQQTYLQEANNTGVGPSKAMAAVPTAPTGPRYQHTPNPSLDSGVKPSRVIATVPTAPTKPWHQHTPSPGFDPRYHWSQETEVYSSGKGKSRAIAIVPAPPTCPRQQHTPSLVYTTGVEPSRGSTTVPTVPSNPRQQYAPSPGYTTGVGPSRTALTHPSPQHTPSPGHDSGYQSQEPPELSSTRATNNSPGKETPEQQAPEQQAPEQPAPVHPAAPTNREELPSIYIPIPRVNPDAIAQWRRNLSLHERLENYGNTPLWDSEPDSFPHPPMLLQPPIQRPIQRPRDSDNTVLDVGEWVMRTGGYAGPFGIGEWVWILGLGGEKGADRIGKISVNV
jgi:hypothetical protein